ncbi:MAG TPA: hypothetical protein VGK17_17065 [Propionicimonas sp.]|jgi:hypothetical protein
MTTNRRRGLLFSALVVVFALTTTGTALAYWARSGSGSGATTTGTTQPLVLSPGTASNQLYPGGQSAVAVTVTNPNPGPVNASSLSLDTSQGTAGFAVDGAHAACGVASLTFATQTNGGAGWAIPASGSSVLSLANSLSMNTNAANACQGASFTVYLKVGP